MNGALSLPSPAQSGREGGRRPGEGELEFMVLRPARHRKQARNQTTHPRPLPGGELVFVRVLSVPLLGGVRGGFMVLSMRNTERRLSTLAPVTRFRRVVPSKTSLPANWVS